MSDHYYLYHMVPSDQVGITLHPLNQLKDTQPELYAKKVQKYEGREHVRERQIPILNCRWNDVLHLSPIPPTDLQAALRAAGHSGVARFFYQIDPTQLESEKAVVYLYKNTGTVRAPNHNEFVPFAVQDLQYYATIPDATKSYFAQETAAGRKPLLFHGIPHILYHGTIDVSNTTVISV